MAEYMLLYKGDATEAKDMDPEKSKEVMQKWGAWMSEIGDKMVNMGSPMNKRGVSIVDDGNEGTADMINGYSIIKAESMEEAKKLSKNHPFLADGTGNFSVEIYEILPNPKM